MCYSAQILADYKKLVRSYGPVMSLEEFTALFEGWEAADAPFRMPKALLDALADEPSLRPYIERHRAREAMRHERELFAQRKRLADAERSLSAKVTKAACESARIARNKIEAARRRLDDLQRTEPVDGDFRIYPGNYAPVIVAEGNRLVIKPMRYQCRIAGKPAGYDRRFPGTYNARRDNLQGFWREQFGHSHGLLVVTAFYENVARPGPAGKAENVVLEFAPRPAQDMLVACLWSHWTAPGEPDLLSFAAITDEPPPEIAAAGHDRCIVPIKPENIGRWLHPDANDIESLQALLDDRARPYFEHRLAA